MKWQEDTHHFEVPKQRHEQGRGENAEMYVRGHLGGDLRRECVRNAHGHLGVVDAHCPVEVSGRLWEDKRQCLITILPVSAVQLFSMWNMTGGIMPSPAIRADRSWNGNFPS